METDNYFNMVHGSVAKRRNPVPLLFLHTTNVEAAADVLDILMKAGGHVFNPGTLIRLPKANPLVRVWISPDTITVEIDRQNSRGTCRQFVCKFSPSEKESWRQSCYDHGGVLLITTSGPDPNYHDKLVRESTDIGNVMAVSATTHFPRQ